MPPPGYGPWEAHTHTLATALHRLGHDVTLFAPEGSRFEGRLVETVPAPLSQAPNLDAKVWEAMHVAAAMERADEFDVVHSQIDLLPLAFSKLVDTPIVATVHGFGAPDTRRRVLPIWRRYCDRVALVAISDANREADLRYAATIHHGIDLEPWPFSDPGPNAPLVFFGRIHPDKGPQDAMRIAREANVPLVMGGIVHDEALFEREVRPHVDGERVSWLGNVQGTERARVLGGARALLHPIGFDEPFGLSVVEAMACGTPVIAYDRGSMPEIVHPGTGFLVRDVPEAVAAVARLPEIDRRDCRAHVERRFTAKRMGRDYERLFRSLSANASA